MTVLVSRPRPPEHLWRDHTVWVSVGIAAVLLGVQAVRVGLFSRLMHWLPPTRTQEAEEEEDYPL